MYRASLKQTWEDVEEEEYTVGDTADLVNSFKKQISKGVNQLNQNLSFAKRYDRMGQSSTESVQWRVDTHRSQAKTLMRPMHQLPNTDLCA